MQFSILLLNNKKQINIQQKQQQQNNNKTAKLCIERGAIVVTADMNTEAGERSAAAIREQGGQIDFVQTDRSFCRSSHDFICRLWAFWQ